MFVLAACSGGTGGTGGVGAVGGAGAVASGADGPDAGSKTGDWLFYVTDRNVVKSDAGATIYGEDRNPSMAFGRVRAAGTGRGGRELVRFPATPLPFSMQAGRIVPEPTVARAYDQSIARVRSELSSTLRAAGGRDVTVFVHGFNNDFEESVQSARILAEASGRKGVFVLFSWPAGHSGLGGYLRDRESGEFSIYHLKETLRILAGVPGLRSIHVIAHSRGSDVATTALREMVIAARASGRSPRDVLKVDNLIMAAPDIDFGVAGQRLLAEQFGPAFGRITVYMNPRDGTLALSQSLMSGIRFGRLTEADLDPNAREIFNGVGNVDFLDVENVVMRSGHGYFRQNPAVLADIGRLIRYSAPPGDPRRALRHLEGNFWAVTNPSRSDAGLSQGAGLR